MRSIVSLLLLTSLLTSCGLLEMKDKLLGTVAESIPWNFEIAMGEKLLPSILPPELEIKDSVLLGDLQKLLAPLLQTVIQPPITLHVSKDPALNAYAIPGGHLIFNRGMLLAADSPEEILGVASHEIAHATQRHTMRTMIQGLSIYALISVFLGDVTGIGAVLIDQGQALIQNGYSRTQEREADSYGVKRLIDADISPEGMIRFFERIEAESQKSGTRNTSVSRFLSTHPETAERIVEIRKTIASVPESQKTNWRPVAFDLKAMKARLGQRE